MVKGVFDEKIPLLSPEIFGLIRGIIFGLLFILCSQGNGFWRLFCARKKKQTEQTEAYSVYLVEEGGLELCSRVRLLTQAIAFIDLWFESTNFRIQIEKTKSNHESDCLLFGGRGWIRTTEVVDVRFTV